MFCRALHPSPLPEQPKKSGKKNKITDKNVSSAENTAQFMLTLCWQRWLAEAIYFCLAMNEESSTQDTFISVIFA